MRLITSFILLHPIICLRIMYGTHHRLHRTTFKSAISMSDIEEDIEKIIVPKQTAYIGDEKSEWDGYMVLKIFIYEIFSAFINIS